MALTARAPLPAAPPARRGTTLTGAILAIVAGTMLMAGLLGFLAWRPSLVSVPEPPQLPGTELIPDVAPGAAPDASGQFTTAEVRVHDLMNGRSPASNIDRAISSAERQSQKPMSETITTRTIAS